MSRLKISGNLRLSLLQFSFQLALFLVLHARIASASFVFVAGFELVCGARFVSESENLALIMKGKSFPIEECVSFSFSRW